jgi:hypothetical protein
MTLIGEFFNCRHMGIVKVVLGGLMPSDYFYSLVKAFIIG